MADNEPSDVGAEAVERFHNDAEFHALAYMAAVMTEHDIEVAGGSSFTRRERNIAQRSAAIAVLLAERKATVDAANKQKAERNMPTDWSGTK